MQPSDDDIRAMLAGVFPSPYTARKAQHGPVDILDARGWDIVTLYGGGEERDATAKLLAAAPDLAALALSRGEALAKAEAEIARLRAKIIDQAQTLSAIKGNAVKVTPMSQKDRHRLQDIVEMASAALGGDDA